MEGETMRTSGGEVERTKERNAWQKKTKDFPGGK